MTHLIETNETMSFNEAVELYDLDPDEVMPEVISVCDGEWRKVGDGYHYIWWKNPEREA